MARTSPGRAEARWQERLDRFEQSGQTVKSFCAAEGVSELSFYHWRKRLGRAPAGRANANAPRPVFQAVQLRAATPMLRVQLPGDVTVEVPAEQHELALAVVREVAQASRSNDAGGA